MIHQERVTDRNQHSVETDRRSRSRLAIGPLAFALSLAACAPSTTPVAATPTAPVAGAAANPVSTTGAATNAVSTTGAPAPRSARCSAAEYRQFDFWVGDWDTFELDNPRTPVARLQVEPIVGGCSLHEIYRQTDGLVGESFSTYDGPRKTWNHTWVTNRGQLLSIDGKAQSDGMILQGPQRGEDGKEKIVRMTWKVQPDGIREAADSSLDGGATWKPMFDLIFRRHPGATAQLP